MAPPDREKAWTCLLINLLVLPGLGSLLAGRRLAGAVQTALALAGFVLTTLWLWAYARALFEQGLPPTGFGPRGELGLAGILVFFASWAWSLASGLGVLRRARRR